MKRILSFLLSFSLIFSQMLVVFSASDTKTNNDNLVKERIKDAIVVFIGSSQTLVNTNEDSIDPSNLEVVPYVLNNRTMLPVRFFTEKLNAAITWDATSKTATINKDSITIRIPIGSSKIYVNDEEKVIDTIAEIKNSRTFLPLRAISEIFGKKVFYDRGLIIVGNSEEPFNITSEKNLIDNLISKVNVLPSINNVENFNKLVESKKDFLLKNRTLINYDIAPTQAPTASESTTNKSDAGKSEYSTTNLQVEGVDEADIIKTDGEFIYTIDNKFVRITSAKPNLSKVSKIQFEDDSFQPTEFYIDGNKLTVIGSSYKVISSTSIDVATSSDVQIEPSVVPKLIPISSALVEPVDIMRPYYPYYNSYEYYTKTYVYDITDKSNPKSLRETKIDGYYINSRKIDSFIYIITNKSLWDSTNSYNVDPNTTPSLPKYSDSKLGKNEITLDLKDIRYFPNSIESNYLNILAIDTNDLEKDVTVSSYLGYSDKLYCSKSNLYVAVTNYNYFKGPMIDNSFSNESTTIYKFSLSGTNITYLKTASVPGYALNQFSMDENGSYFRITTTTNLSNQLYVLDDTMNIVGKIEDIAKGEKIYSTRFMGNRCYIVTFKTVDPLFVIDLEDATSPKILGYLKIPGFSDYLHPYDETHLIGFGKDTVEINGNAYYLGMKLSLFDVSNVEKPIEMFKELIGDRGTNSDVLSNHKALTFSKNKNLLAFPIDVNKVAGDKMSTYGHPTYGELVYSGAYVYNIDLTSGFKLRGSITHHTDDLYNYEERINRVLYIDDILYGVSNKIITSNDMTDCKEIQKLILD